MNKKLKNTLILSFVLVLVLPTVVLLVQEFNTENSSDSSPENLKINSEGDITITIRYLSNYTFEIKMDTHSGSLDYNLTELSYIKLLNNQKLLPLSWNGPLGGHHIAGLLEFPSFNYTDEFDLIIEDVGRIPSRTFSW
ncbi:MAG: hypothetical protein HeimC3_01360 [Candidatus Heimdallarchaeota archaeon LC_3]|nr:MAG: hypothetical protein HeimC3_01360 [Candidatus Heimdallarchaeota archaeon LC_3]